MWMQKNGIILKYVLQFNDESQGSIAKNLRCDELLVLYYTFIIHLAGERIFKIGEHLTKLRAKSLTVSYTPFALQFCPQRCRSRQISWITCVLQTQTVIKRCYVNRQLNVSYLSRNIKLLWTSFDLLTDRLTLSVTDWLLIMYGILTRQLFFVAAVVYSGSWDFLYGRCQQLLLVNEIMLISPDIYFKTVFEWLSLA